MWLRCQIWHADSVDAIKKARGEVACLHNSSLALSASIGKAFQPKSVPLSSCHYSLHCMFLLSYDCVSQQWKLKLLCWFHWSIAEFLCRDRGSCIPPWLLWVDVAGLKESPQQCHWTTLVFVREGYPAQPREEGDE